MLRFAARRAKAAQPTKGARAKASATARRCAALMAVLITVLVAAAGPARAQVEEARPRVITLTPHATEMVYAAGGGKYIVGTVTSSDYPEEARGIPRIGDGIMLNQERIVMLSPTLFVGWLRSGVAMQVERLAGPLQAHVHYSRPERLRDIPADLRRLGQLMGTADVAAEAASALELRIDALERQYRGKPPVTVFMEVGSAPLYTIGSDPLLNDALRLCSVANVYGDSGVPAPRVPVESVLVQNPALIVAAGRHAGETQASLARWADYGLPAAVKGHVHAADPDALFRPGPRFVDAMETLCEAADAVRAGPAGP